ncbi:hypothetical protein ABA80_001509 [Salmonella enterica subsp. enterica]|nr:hypothetical protein [Salmonella enterica subsp. enterica serovar Orion]
MGSCAAPSAKGDDKFITTDYLQQCLFLCCKCSSHSKNLRNPMFSHNCCVDQLNLQRLFLICPVRR